MDQIFNLNIFTNIEQEFGKTDFNAIYLPQLTNKFIRLQNPKYNAQTIDTNDYTMNLIFIKFQAFSIKLSSGHARLIVDYQSNDIVDLTPLLIQLINKNNDTSIKYLITQLLSIYSCSLDQLAQLGEKGASLPFIFYFTLFDNGTKASLFSYLNDNISKDSGFVPLANNIIKQLMDLPDLVYFNRAMQNLKNNLNHAIGKYLLEQISRLENQSSLRNFKITEELINITYADQLQHEQAYQLATKAAKDALNSTNITNRFAALALFQALFKKRQAYIEAINVAKEAFNSKNVPIRVTAFQLFKELVNQGQAYTDATNAAKEAFDSTDECIRNNAFQLFEALVNKGQAYTDATDAAKKAFDSTDGSMRATGLFLFKALVNKGQAYMEATSTAINALNGTDESIGQVALDLFKALVNKGQAYTDATDAAKKAFDSTNISIYTTALELFKALLNQRQAYTDVTNAAKKAFNSTNISIRNRALKLFEELVNQGQAYTDATDVAIKAINDKLQIYLYEKAFDVFNKLIAKNHSLNEIAEALQIVLSKDSISLGQKKAAQGILKKISKQQS